MGTIAPVNACEPHACRHAAAKTEVAGQFDGSGNFTWTPPSGITGLVYLYQLTRQNGQEVATPAVDATGVNAFSLTSGTATLVLPPAGAKSSRYIRVRTPMGP